jgi:hypothetical protein
MIQSQQSPRWLFLLLLAGPLLLSSRVATSADQSVLPPIFAVGKELRDDLGRVYQILQLDGEWARVKILRNGSNRAGVLFPSNDITWLHVPTAHVWTIDR